MTWPWFDPRCHYGLLPWDRNVRRTAQSREMSSRSVIRMNWPSLDRRRAQAPSITGRGHLRTPPAAHSREPSGLIRKADEWCAWGEELLLCHPIASQLSVAPLNESRPQVNMPLGCQSIPVTCNTNTQNPLSYKINVLLVHPVLLWPNPIDSLWRALEPMYDRSWTNDLMAGATRLAQLGCLYDFRVIAPHKMRKQWILKNWGRSVIGKAINHI